VSNDNTFRRCIDCGCTSEDLPDSKYWSANGYFCFQCAKRHTEFERATPYLEMPLKFLLPHTVKLPSGRVNEGFLVSSRPSALALQMAKRGRTLTTFIVNHSTTSVDNRCLIYCDSIKAWVDVEHIDPLKPGHGDISWADHELMCPNPKCPVRTGGE
jgi:hypothetical protein